MRMRTYIRPSVLVIAIFITACGGGGNYQDWIYANKVTQQEIKTPNGEKGYVITCNDFNRYVSWADCYRKASEMCGPQYNVLDRSDTQRRYKEFSSAERTLIIECTA